VNAEDTALALRLGRTLKRLRTELGWTQAQLAETVEMSVNHVGYLERGERLPSVPMLVGLARVLGTTTAELLGEDEVREPARKRALSMVRALPLATMPTVIAMLHGARKLAHDEVGESADLSEQQARRPAQEGPNATPRAGRAAGMLPSGRTPSQKKPHGLAPTNAKTR